MNYSYNYFNHPVRFKASSPENIKVNLFDLAIAFEKDLNAFLESEDFKKSVGDDIEIESTEEIYVGHYNARFLIGTDQWNHKWLTECTFKISNQLNNNK